jgi:hypothetical protein
MQVPHTYSVWQPLPSNVYLRWNRHPKIAEILVYTHVVDICLLLRSTHILSDNHCNHMCICDGIGTQKSLKFTFIHTFWTFACFVCICEAIGARKLLKLTFIHTVPTFACFFALNFRQSPSRIEIFRILLHARTPHTFCLTTTRIKCVFVKKKAPENRSQVDVYTDGLDISLILCSQLPPKSWNDRDMPDSTPNTYPTHILSDSHYHPKCIGKGIGTQKSLELRLYSRTPRFTSFMLWTSATVLQSLSYAGIKSTQVPHTYFILQLLPSYVYLRRNRPPCNHSKMRLYTRISQILCSQLLVKCCNHWGMPESTSCRNPTHILYLNNYKHLCGCEAFVVQQTPRTITPIYGFFENFTDLACLHCVNLLESQRHGLVKSIHVPHAYSVSHPLPSYVYLWRSRHPKTTRSYEYIAELDHFYALNLLQSAGITEVWRNQVHAGTPRIFCLTTTTVICVFVKE